MEDKNFLVDYQKLLFSIERLKKSEENPFFKSSYVPLKEILSVVKKHCLEANFIFYQYPAIKNGQNVLVTEIEHASGRKITGEVPIISKDPNDPQKVGAGMTYMRRYSLTCMFGLEEEDDDGNEASAQRPRRQSNNITL